MFHPPYPGGGDSPSIQCQGRSRQPLCRQREHPNRDPAPLPRALYPGYRQSLPAPCEGGGRRRGTRRVVGVFQQKKFSVTRERPGGGGVSAKGVFSDMMKQGRGDPRTPFPVARRDRGGGCSTPLPGEPHRYTARESVATVSADPPSRFCLCPVHGIRTIANHCPPPLEGAGGGAERAGRRGCFRQKGFSVTPERPGGGGVFGKRGFR